jgi:hypothetical protein
LRNNNSIKNKIKKMIKQLGKKSYAFISMIILFIFFLIFINSCKKEVSKDITQENHAIETNTSAILPIVYTDINPDTTIVSGHSYQLDINKDGIADYEIWVNCSEVGITSLGNNEVLADSSQFEVLDSNVSIGSASKIWVTPSSGAALDYYTTQKGGCGPGAHATGGCTDYRNWGPFQRGIPGFLGLRIHKGSAIYYGWVRLTVFCPVISSPTAPLQCFSMKIQDYAYNSASGQSILAAQKK